MRDIAVPIAPRGVRTDTPAAAGACVAGCRSTSFGSANEVQSVSSERIARHPAGNPAGVATQVAAIPVTSVAATRARWLRWRQAVVTSGADAGAAIANDVDCTLLDRLSMSEDGHSRGV
jgi:hypothetical protein